MNFVKVTAKECSSDGRMTGMSIPKEFLLNADLIGAIKGTEIWLKGGDRVNLGGGWYRDIHLAQGVKIPTL